MAKKSVDKIKPRIIRYSFLFWVPFFLHCKSEPERVVYTEKGEIINYGDMDIEDNEAASLFNKGLKSVEERDFYAADEYFKKADSLEKDNPTILNSLALINEKFSNYEEAENIYRRVFALDSTNINAYSNYGRFLFTQNKFEEANQILIKGYDRSRQNNGYIQPNLLFNLALSYGILKDCTNAIKFAKLAQDSSDDVNIRQQAAELIQNIRQRCRS